MVLQQWTNHSVEKADQISTKFGVETTFRTGSSRLIIQPYLPDGADWQHKIGRVTLAARCVLLVRWKCYELWCLLLMFRELVWNACLIQDISLSDSWIRAERRDGRRDVQVLRRLAAEPQSDWLHAAGWVFIHLWIDDGDDNYRNLSSRIDMHTPAGNTLHRL